MSRVQAYALPSSRRNAQMHRPEHNPAPQVTAAEAFHILRSGCSSLSTDQMLTLQRAVGNQGVRHVLMRPASEQEPSFVASNSCSERVMRKGFESTIEICHRVLKSREFEVTKGGVRVVLDLRKLNKDVPNCQDFKFGVTLTKVGSVLDNEIATCEATTGGLRTFSFAGVAPGTYYLTIWRNFDHPYCCLEGGISVLDEAEATETAGCTKHETPSVLDIIHAALDVAGFIPVLGAIPDGANALIYVAEGDWTSAGISAVAMVPVFGDGAKLAIRGGKEVIEVSGKTVLKIGKEELAAGLKKVAARKTEKEAAEQMGKEAAKKLEKETAEKLGKEATEKELKRKIAECEAIHAAYKALGNCQSCKPDDTAAERVVKAGCLTALIAGRKRYLDQKCDYVLPGSIARGSAIAEKGHKIQVEQLMKMLAKCSKLPTI